MCFMSFEFITLYMYPSSDVNTDLTTDRLQSCAQILKQNCISDRHKGCDIVRPDLDSNFFAQVINRQ